MNLSAKWVLGCALEPPARQLERLKRFIDKKAIEVAIPGELRRPGERLTRYERIGGLTNRNYKVFLGDEVLVLRLPGRGTGRFINRAHERANHREAAKAGLTPEALYFNRLTGVKVTSFLDDALTFSPATARSPEAYRRIAEFLRGFHDAPVSFQNRFNGFRMSRKYEQIARSRFIAFYRGYKAIRERVFALERLLKAMGTPLRACHNDLVPENILEVDGRLQLIDWEYSGMNDPAWDVASFLLECEFSEAEESMFIDRYLGSEEVRERFVIRVRAYMILQDFLWSLWSLLYADAHKGKEKEAYYLRYGVERFDRARSGIKAFDARADVVRLRSDLS